MGNSSDFVIRCNVLIQYKGSDEEVVIPNGVIAIEYGAFSSVGDVERKRITLPESVRRVQANAFSGCSTLTEVIVLGKDTRFDPRAFFHYYKRGGCCPEVISDVLPLGRLPEEVRNHTILTLIQRRKREEVISESRWKLCIRYVKRMRKKLFPLALENRELFYLMLEEKMLTQDDFPELMKQAEATADAEIISAMLEYQEQNLQRIDPDAEFEKQITILETKTLPVADAKKIWRYTKNKKGEICLLGYKGKELDVMVPAKIGKDPVTEIGTYALSPQAKPLTEEVRGPRIHLKSVFLPQSVRKIADTFLAGCMELESVTVESGNSKYQVQDGLLVSKDGKEVLCVLGETCVVPEGVTVIKSDLFTGKKFVRRVVLPQSLREIDRQAFAWCDGLEELDIPENVVKLGDEAFDGCGSLRSVRIPGGVREIGASAFHFCLKLERVTFSEGLEVIGVDAFCGSALREAELPNSVTRIQPWAFARCSELSRVELPAGLRVLEAHTFEGSGLEQIVLPAGLEEIERDVFAHCGQLKEVVFSQNLQKIGQNAFISSGLERVVVPGNVKTVGACAFQNCKQLKSIEFQEGVKELRTHMFAWCENLTEIILPASVVKLGAELLENSNWSDRKRGDRAAQAVLYAPSGSAAEAYAKENSIPFRAL